MVVLVCGGRDYTNKDFLFQSLDALHAKRNITYIIHGAARGADLLSEQWAKSRQIDYRGFPARWGIDGKKKAGPMRNQRMLENNLIEGVVAFDGGSGTNDMVSRSKKAGIIVWDLRGKNV